MKRTFLITAAVLVAIAAPAAATHRPGHNAGGTANLTAATSPTPVVFGTATTVSGKLTGRNNAGRQVQLAEDPYPYGDGFNNLATAMTDANGNYTFRVTPASNRNYRVSVGTEQAFTGVRVRSRVSFGVTDLTPRMGQRVAFFGYVYPAHNGRTLLVQRRTATGFWSVVRRIGLRAAATGDRSRYRTVFTIRRSGTYRTRILGHGDHLLGTSRTRALRVP